MPPGLVRPDLAVQAEPPTSHLRTYDASKDDKVKQHYYDQHQNQTVAFAQGMLRRFRFPVAPEDTDRERMSLLGAVDKFEFVDTSDPDFESNNLLHAYMTGEACRQIFPDDDWMHLVGFIHDLGKAPLDRAGVPTFAIGGDTYPLGMAPPNPDSVVYGIESFEHCSDRQDPAWETEGGMLGYTPGMGFDNVLMAYGHDQYFFDVLTNHPECNIPHQGLYVIRFHSFYPWHQKDQQYTHLASQTDWDNLELLRRFQTCDLYSKVDELPDMEALRPYYAGLIEKYCPGVLTW
jgi:inositol oxygenase